MQNPRRKLTVAILTAAIGIWSASATAQQKFTGPFTDAQAATGHDAYAKNCATCHQNNLSGSGEAPALAGVGFIGSWSNRTTQDLFNQIKLSMPLGNPNTLGDDIYAAITAFLLKANGAKAGTTELTPATGVRIGPIADGKVPAEIAQASLAATAATSAGSPPTAASARARGGRAPVSPGLTVAGIVKNYTPVTDDMMDNPPDSDWIMHYRNYAGWSHSPLKQINTHNVGSLELRWVWAMDEDERQQITPLVHDGVMFLSNNHTNKVQALDARTGDLIWENSIGPIQENAANATRTMVLYGDKLFYPATDAKLYALDARTGKIVWRTVISSYGNDKIGGMMAVRGKLIVGLTRCDDQSVQDHCYIAAYDVDTGKQVWKFLTIADKGTVGGDSWGNLSNDQRAGADAWISGTYDPKLNLTFWGTGQAKGAQSGIHSDVLFSNTTLALDADTGKLKWYHQDAPDKSLDLDEVYEKVLVDEGDQKDLITVGKKGIMWKLDRVTGKFLDYRQTVFQNVFTSINPKTGRATYRPDIIAQKPGELIASCPSEEGGHDWPATSYDPDDDLMVLPLSQTCVMNGGGGQLFYEMPGSDGNLGRISAYEAKTFKPVWTFQQRSPFLTGVMTTGGGLGFVGDWDRVVRAFDVKTGKTLWESRLGTTVQGFITTFSVGGEQFVAVPTGYNGGSPEKKPSTMLTGDLNRPMTGHAVYVFALPQAH